MIDGYIWFGRIVNRIWFAAVMFSRCARALACKYFFGAHQLRMCRCGCGVPICGRCRLAPDLLVKSGLL